mmetsp:Transcript_26402/g.88779  ORF Transcript_26402/g.88779 Transcript_26402/m.88779 type:complete len:195 (+) Transcript_26402:1531-2115(+)
MSAAAMVPVACLTWFLAEPAARVFTNDAVVVAATASYLRIVALCFPALAVEAVYDGALTGACVARAAPEKALEKRLQLSKTFKNSPTGSTRSRRSSSGSSSTACASRLRACSCRGTASRASGLPYLSRPCSRRPPSTSASEASLKKARSARSAHDRRRAFKRIFEGPVCNSETLALARASATPRLGLESSCFKA